MTMEVITDPTLLFLDKPTIDWEAGTLNVVLLFLQKM